MRGALRNAISTFFPRAVSSDAAIVKRPLIRPSATFSPTKSVGEKALDGKSLRAIPYKSAFFTEKALDGKMLPRNPSKGQKSALLQPPPAAAPQ